MSHAPEDRRAPPWASFVLVTTIGTALAIAGWSLRSQVEHEARSSGDFAGLVTDVRGLRRDVDLLKSDGKGMPSRGEFDRMGAELAGLRQDVQRLTEAVMRGRR